MSATHTFIDPEISDLMREILSNPKARLFRTLDPKTLPGLTRMTEPVGLNAPGLVPAERHLLKVYRQEVAWLLRQAALTRMYEDPEKSRLLRKSVTVDRDLELCSATAIKRRIRAARTSSQGGGLSDAEWKRLGLEIQASEGPPNIGALCAASLKLAPSDEARIYLAVDIGMRGHAGTGVSMLRNVANAPSTALIASFAWQNIGMLQAETRKPREAFGSYLAAVAAAEDRPVPAIARLHFAARTGSPSDTLRAATILDDLLRPSHAAVVEQCSSPPPPMLKPSSQKVLGAIREKLGPTSRSVTNVFFEA